MKDHKSVIYLVIFALTASFLGWGVWKNYRPQVIYASCTDITEKTTNVRNRKDINDPPEQEFDILLNECLSEAGYFSE